MGEFPEGEAPGSSGSEVADGTAQGEAGEGQQGSESTADAGSQGEGGAQGGGGEPGFEDSAGGDALPSMEDEQTVAGNGAGQFPGSQGEGQDQGQGQGNGAAGGDGGGFEASVSVPGMPGGVGIPGIPGLPGLPGDGGLPGGGSGSGNGEDSSATPGFPGGGGYGGFPQSEGPMTPGEEVAILDAELERGMGEFDAMILEEQAAQRRADREAAANEPVQTASAEGVPGAGTSDNGYGREIGGGGGYSTGGGMGGPRGGGTMPKDAAKYPPPEDIPSGNDDDVVARQLREAAMREADPAVREKLWAEYRKYKGIRQP